MCTQVVAASAVELRNDESAATMTVAIDDRPVVAYQYGPKFALPHLYPVASPSGHELTVQHPDLYPHHRSIWIADRVQLAGGPDVDFYHCWKNYRQADKPESGFKHFIRHQRFSSVQAEGNGARINADLKWIVNENQPVLDERRTMRVIAFENGEYRLDLSWQLTASYGNVKFSSDAVHYAWPYVRMQPRFSGEQGGTIVNSTGAKGQAGTNGKVAEWVDYSYKIDGNSEGLALFIDRRDGPCTWLTREYGTFGPRRPEKFNGTQFTLVNGESLSGRAAILVHRGDATNGRVAQRYRDYVSESQ